MKRAFLFAVAALAAGPAFAQLAPVAAFESARGMLLSSGAWSYRSTPAASESIFAGRLRIRCDRVARRVSVQRIDVAAVPGVTPPAILVATDSLARSLAPSGASLGAFDPLLDAIAFSRGRFVVSGGGGETLVVPAWPEAARSIEDCRN